LTFNSCAAHMIRNASSKRHQSVRLLKARHRWCLTGTPIYNRVEDFAALLSFLRAYPFDTTSFNKYVVLPLKNDSPQGIRNLRNLVQSLTLRRTKASVLGDLQLTSRMNRVKHVQLDDGERRQYDILKRSFSTLLNSAEFSLESSKSSGCIFQTILRLRQFCNHGRDLLPPEISSALDEHTDIEQFSQTLLKKSESCESCKTKFCDGGSSEANSSTSTCGHRLCSNCVLERQTDDYMENQGCPLCFEQPLLSGVTPRSVSPEGVDDVDSSYEPSSKVRALLQNLLDDRAALTDKPVKRY
jgi:SWI/SNF-related matrix-associated actin-dependent regulator of chromatin subfamily A3